MESGREPYGEEVVRPQAEPVVGGREGLACMHIRLCVIEVSNLRTGR